MPVTFIWSAVVAVISTLKTLLVFMVRAPVFIVPIAPAVAPGLMMAVLPLAVTVPVIVPEPPNVPVPFTVTLPVPVPEPVALLTNSVPALTVVAPV